ncbi:hypothetical protein ACHELOUS_193 [Vibrio phage Achelous]|uniref:Uncharacterized protein n=1 Tax=Vibrio phage Achelous TaxID=2576872 RepID=A0A4P8MXN3_9CAUD|nr:hypothetical protein KNU52_gp102 [Vibrio phage Achelous]QCQ57768.1 hypothetical protein ACHELOUS_193 [Vibrio phage Achelous]
MVTGMSLPNKYYIEQALQEVAYSFPSVFHVMLSTDTDNNYTARVCYEGHKPFTVTKKIWEYDELILEVEQRLLEITTNASTHSA